MLSTGIIWYPKPRILVLGILENHTVSEVGFHYMLSIGITWYPRPRISSLGILQNTAEYCLGYHYPPLCRYVLVCVGIPSPRVSILEYPI